MEKMWSDPENAIKCPKCGGENNHMQSYKIFSGDDNYSSNGCLVVESLSDISFEAGEIKTENRLRNLGIEISFSCESGHIWRRDLIFHKGITYMCDNFLYEIDCGDSV